MKNLLILPFLLFCHLGFSQFWQQINDFPSTGRDDPASFTIGNTAYCGTGQLPFFIPTTDFYSFDMNTESWDTAASFPGSPRQYATGLAGSGRGFIYGGYDGSNYFSDLWSYDPSTDSWSSKTPLPGPARMGCASFVINGIAYIIGGRTAAEQSVKEVWAYDIANNFWQQKNDLPAARWRSVATCLANKGYLALGRDENSHFSNELFEYDPTADTWSLISNAPFAGRTYSAMVSYANDLIILAGLDSIGNNYNDMWRVNPSTLMWQQLQSIPSAGRRGGACFNSTSAIYFTTGVTQNGTRLKETWKVLNPVSINEIKSAEQSVTCYPNPANEQTTLYLPDFENEVTVSLFDAAGNLVQKFSSKENIVNIGTTKLKSGLYFFKVSTNWSSCFKVLIQH
jgi:N-acetylneuraminic acid mutarotase